jgi:hypothetical protein
VGEAAQSPGKPPPSIRRRASRVIALVAGATLLTGLLQTTEATSSQAAAGSGSRTATVSVDSLSPRIPVAGDTITVTGHLSNDGKSAITDAHVGIRMPWGGPLSTRSAIKSATSRNGYSNAQDGNEIPGHVTNVPDIPVGGDSSFTLTVPVSALGLDSAGVYQLGVTLDGRTSADPTEHVLGIKRTFLPWYGDAGSSSTKSTRINYLWPLTDRSHIAPRGDTDSQVSPIFMDDDLATELGTGGRLRQMIDLARNLPVTWIVDPDLLATVEFMTKGYRVAEPGSDGTKTTTGSAAARQWLNDLKTAVAGDQVIALPFGDTDVASLAHHGRSVPGAVTHLKTAAALGLTTTETIFGGVQTADVAWPVDGALDPSIVSVARAAGGKRIIARSDTFSEGNLSYTPNAARQIGGGTTAVVADATLSTAFTGDLADPQKANLAVQSFIAQTLMITMEAPEKQRSVVVAPQRMPNIAQAQAMAQAIHYTSDASAAPWISPVTFDDVAKAHPDARANHKVPSSKSYPSGLRKQELPTIAFEQLRQTQIGLNNFVVILTQPNRVTVPFRNAVLHSMSNGWRGDPAGSAYRNAIGDYLTDLIGAVHIIEKTTLTLSGRSGTIPVTVKNELGQPVKGLVLRLVSGANIRLEIKDADQPITIEGGHTRTLKFQTTASANGTVRITAQLYTDKGALYGIGTGFEVHVNKVTDLVMLIIGAGLLLLVLAGVRIYRQRKRQAAEDRGENDGDGGDDGEADGSDPGQPGDPAADTGQESQEPSPAGEKVDG